MVYTKRESEQIFFRAAPDERRACQNRLQKICRCLEAESGMRQKFSSKKEKRRGVGQVVAAAVMALAITVSGVGTTVLYASQPAGLTVASVVEPEVPLATEEPEEDVPQAQEPEAASKDVTVTVTETETAEQQETAAEEPAASAPAQENTAASREQETAAPAQTQTQTETAAPTQTVDATQTAEAVTVTEGNIEEENTTTARFVQETPELAAEDPLAPPTEAEEDSAAQRAAESMEDNPILLTPEQIEQALDEGALSDYPSDQNFDLNDENCLKWLWNWLFGSLFPSSSQTQTKYSGWRTDAAGNTYYYSQSTHQPLTGIHTIDGVLYYFDANGVKQNATFGIDVSKYQTNIDWKKVKTSGVEFVIIRLGYRGYSTGTLVEDPMFESHYSGAKAAGLRIGVYAFSQAINEDEAREEALACVYVLDGRSLDYPIYFDTEASGSSNGTGRADGLSTSDRTKCAVAFCEEVKASGYEPGVYASTQWFNKRLNMSQLKGYSIWNAHYDVAQSGVSCDIWQGVCDGKVNGYSGGIDVNVSFIG